MIQQLPEVINCDVLVRHVVQSDLPEETQAAYILMLCKMVNTGGNIRELTNLARNALGDARDPELHSASELLLRRLSALESETNDKQNPDGRWFTTGFGHKMVVIDPSEINTNASNVLKHYKIQNPFAISTTPETIAQFRKYKDRNEWNGTTDGFQQRPVDKVSHWIAMGYCNWLSKRAGLPEEQLCYQEIGERMQPVEDFQDKRGFRLPTEEEWECACRANTMTSAFCPPDVLKDYAWIREELDPVELYTHPVATKLPNPFGLFDILGNVSEYCQDSSPLLTFPPIPYADRFEMHPDTTRVHRGGSVRTSVANSSRRYHCLAQQFDLHSGLPAVGFRIVCSMRHE